MELNEIILKLKDAFKNEEVKKAVLKEDWYQKNIESGIDSTGFCYAASEIIYRLSGGKENWKKASISEKKWEHGGHCFLINKKNGEILDITADQYTLKNIKIPYEIATYSGFRTPDFSNSARKLAQSAGLIN